MDIGTTKGWHPLIDQTNENAPHKEEWQPADISRPAKGGWVFRISDLVKNPDGTDI